MPKLPQFRYIATALLTAIAAGCATDSSRWLDYDESRDRLLLVVGDFSSIEWLNEALPCPGSASGGNAGNEPIVDCVNEPPGIASLNVKEVVYGEYPGQRLQVAHRASRYTHAGAPGDGKPMLVLLHTDGKHYFTSRLRLLARTTQGEWALPVEREELLDILPCGAGPLVKPLRFSQPLPSESLEHFDENDIEELRQNPRVKVHRDRYTITHGIPLSDIKKLIAERARPTPKDYECPYYGLPDSKFTIEGLDSE